MDSGPQVETLVSSVDGTVQPYGLYVPRGYDPHKRYPVVVMLHGAGDNERLSLRRVFGWDNLPGESDSEASRWFPAWRDMDCFVVAPYARGTKGYLGTQEQDVLDALAEVKRRFSIDPQSAYLTGLSMGGGGALWIGLRHPELWRSIAAVCPSPPTGVRIFAENAKGLPITIFQGSSDTVVPAESTRDIVNLLRLKSSEVSYFELRGAGHNVWGAAYREGQLLHNTFNINFY